MCFDLGGVSYEICLVFCRVGTEDVGDEFDRTADDNDNKEPGAIFDHGKVSDDDERYPIDGRSDYRQGEGGIVHPDGVFRGHDEVAGRVSREKRVGDNTMKTSD